MGTTKRRSTLSKATFPSSPDLESREDYEDSSTTSEHKQEYWVESLMPAMFAVYERTSIELHSESDIITGKTTYIMV